MPQELAPGDVFAGHRIEALAGRGGMGIVYRATHLALDRLVAIKVIAPDLATDTDFRARFEQESRIAASIDHPHVIPILHAGEDEGRLYITMRYVEGTDLAKLLSQSGSLPAPRAVQIIAQVADALDAAHAAGLVHRDVKPANVLIAYRGTEPHCYLTDFGLTKRVDADGGPTKTGQWVGTIDYVAPEQIQGLKLDARADVYALGCVLYHLLTGDVPYSRPSAVAKMFAHVNDPPPSLPQNLPAELDAVIQRAMAKQPSERYPSAGDLGRAAAAAIHGEEPIAAERSVAIGDAAPVPTTIGQLPDAQTNVLPVSEPSAPPPPPSVPSAPSYVPPPSYPAAPAPPNRRPVVLASLVVVLALVGAVIALAAAGTFSGGDDENPPTTTGANTGATTTTTTETPETTDTTGPTDNGISSDEIETVVDDYSAAYTNESTDDLGNLLTADAERTSTIGSGTSTQTGRDEILAEYRRQWDATETQSYTLDNVEMKNSGDDASVTADYTIRRGGAEDATGRISLHLVPEDDGLLIDRIDAVADSE